MCDNYGICGPNGACNIDNSPLCGCLEGFRPNFSTKRGLSGCNICLYENDSTENCSCTAFANLDIRAGGRGCLMWYCDLFDSRTFNGNGQDIYIRLAASEPDNAKSKVKKTRIVVTSTVLSAGLLILGLALLLCFQKKKRQQDGKLRLDQKEDPELPLFDLGTVICATNDFSNHNKVGEGGFGSVYKGTLMDGQEIAVKRLSKFDARTQRVKE